MRSTERIQTKLITILQRTLMIIKIRKHWDMWIVNILCNTAYVKHYCT